MRCPYVGLEAYTEAQSHYFFGRERETRVNASNIYAAPLTILYGGSGVGKSSVLRAGVVRYLRSKPHTAVVVFRDWQSHSFLNGLKRACVEAAEREHGSALGIDPTLPLDELLLAASEGFGGTILVILDQFEEYFLYQPAGDANNRFDAELARSINRVDVDANFLVALREDGLAKLDRFDARIPNLPGNTLRLEHLDREAAEQAIRGPLARYKEEYGNNAGPTEIEDGLVDAILAQVCTANAITEMTAGEGDRTQIETPLLQLVMTRLWEEERNDGSPTLRLATLEQRLHGVKNIVQQHLNAVMDTLSEEHKNVCSSFFDRLVTPSGTKFACRRTDLTTWAGDLTEHVQPVLDQLSANRWILRTINPPPGDNDVRYEVFHDVLAPAILAWQAQYLQARKEATEKVAAEAALKVRELEHQKELEHQQSLLDEQRQRADAQAQLALEKDSAAAQSKTFARRMIVVAVVAIGVAGMAVYEWKVAQDARQGAQGRELTAAAVSNLGIDPERSVLLASRALSVLRRVAGQHTNDATDALNRAVYVSRSRLTVAHGRRLNAVAFSPDGKRVATAGEDNTLIVWEAVSGDKLHTMKGHSKPISSIAFSPDGTQIATGGEDRSVRLWHAASGSPLRTFSGHSDQVTAVSFSIDNTLASAGNDGKAIIWNAVPGGPPRVLSGHANGQFILGLVFSPDGTRFVTASTDGTAIIWDTKLGSPWRTLKHTDTDFVLAVAFSHDGKLVATGGADRKLILWDAHSGEKLHILTGHTNSVLGIAFSPNGMLATASSDSTAKVWDPVSGMEVFELVGHTSPVAAIAFSADSARAATASWDGTMKVWDATRVHTAGVVNLAVSRDGKRMASASRDHTATIWDAASGQALFTLRGHGGELMTIVFSRDGRRIATASEDKTVIVWDGQSGQRLSTLDEHSEPVTDIAFSPDGSRIATAHRNGNIGLWDVEAVGKRPRPRYILTPEGDRYAVSSVSFSRTGSMIAGANENGVVTVWDANKGDRWKTTLEPKHPSQVRKVAFSDDGAHMASVDNDGNIRLWLWHGSTLEHERFIEKGHKGMIMDAAFNSDGSRLATASLDNTAGIWDIKSEKKVMLKGHANAVTRVTFSPDGKRVATASWDRSAKVWDAESGKEIFTFRHEREVTDVAFSRDGKRLVTASEDKSVRVNYLEFNDLLRVAESRMSRSLTPIECRNFLGTETCPPTSPGRRF